MSQASERAAKECIKYVSDHCGYFSADFRGAELAEIIDRQFERLVKAADRLIDPPREGAYVLQAIWDEFEAALREVKGQ